MSDIKQHGIGCQSVESLGTRACDCGLHETQSNTPETDAECKALDTWKPNDKGKEEYHKRCRLINFARRLERERDEARKQVNELNNLLRHAGWGQGEIDSSAIIAEENDLLITERDQLRKVADELAGLVGYINPEMNSYSTKVALDKYNNLPHVIERKDPR